MSATLLNLFLPPLSLSDTISAHARTLLEAHAMLHSTENVSAEGPVIPTRFTRSFAVRHPVVSAPMALVSGGRLASAVSDAGGLGFVGGGYAGALGGEPDLHRELSFVRRGRFGIGFISWALALAPDVLDAALPYGPAAVFLSFGDVRPFAKRIHAAGARLICQVQTLRHVQEALDAGAHVIVAQGAEAGGHGAKRATFTIVPEIADFLAAHAPDALLLAAGGIADGRGLAAALMLGADAVVVGTRFWAAEEALTPPAAVQRALGCGGDDTVRTSAIDMLRGVPWPEEFSFRLLKNKLTDEWAGREGAAAAAYGTLASDYAAARTRLDFDMIAVPVGEGIGLVRTRLGAAEILRQMVAQADRLLRRRA